MTLSTTADLAVIGAGVIGLSIAAEAIKTGRRVLVLDNTPVPREVPPHTRVSAASFACINIHEKHPESYAALHQRAIALHHERDGRANGAHWLHLVGVEVDGEFHPDWGYADVDAYLSAHESAFESFGGEIFRGISVSSLASVEPQAPEASDVRIDTSAGRITASQVVIAAGAETHALLPAELRAGRLATTAGQLGFLARIRGESPVPHVVLNDALNVRPDAPGQFAVQSLALEAELARERIPATAETVWAQLKQLLRERYELTLSDDALISIDEAPRPLSADGLPVLGWLHESIYVALTHSGINLAPLIGVGVARELSGTVEPDFLPFRPDSAPTLWPASTNQ